MKTLYELDENSVNLVLTNIRDEIRKIHDEAEKSILITDKHDGINEEDLVIQIDRILLEQALLTQIENSLRVNKDKEDLAFHFDYCIKSGFLEVRYSNNGLPANPKIAAKMFTNKYHRGDGEGGGFGQQLIQKVLNFHKEGNLKGSVRMNRDAEKEFGFTMSFPLPSNQR